MKKVFCAILCIALMLTLCGCAYNKSSIETQGNDGRISTIYNDGFVMVCRDNATGVQYLSRTNGGTCVMVDADGKPYTGED